MPTRAPLRCLFAISDCKARNPLRRRILESSGLWVTTSGSDVSTLGSSSARWQRNSVATSIRCATGSAIERKQRPGSALGSRDFWVIGRLASCPQTWQRAYVRPAGGRGCLRPTWRLGWESMKVASPPGSGASIGRRPVPEVLSSNSFETPRRSPGPPRRAGPHAGKMFVDRRRQGGGMIACEAGQESLPVSRGEGL